MFSRTFSLYFLLFILSSCGQSSTSIDQTSKEEAPLSPEMAIQDSLWKEVMVIHDEVMPKMGDINKTSRALKAKLEADPELNETIKAQINETMEALNAADEAMWEWMHNLKQLKPLRNTLSHLEILQYLETEKIAIAEVKDRMLGSINEGKTLLEQLENVDQNN